MRLPFTARKGQESTDPAEATVSGDEHGDEHVADDASERSTSHQSIPIPLDTPATSYSSNNSTTDRESKKAGMYKLSVVDNSGTFLPPSPPDTGRESGVRAWSLHRKRTKEERIAAADGPFIISRESFEGYRRSFDIGGTSPTLVPSPLFGSTPRLSLDSNVNPISIRAESRLRVSSIPTKVEEGASSDSPFEEVKLDEDRPSRRNILSRFGFSTGRTITRKRDGEELQSFRNE